MAEVPTDDPKTTSTSGSDDPTVVVDPARRGNGDEPLWAGGAVEATDESDEAPADEPAPAASGPAAADEPAGDQPPTDAAAAANEAAAALKSKASGAAGKAGERASDAGARAGAKAAAFAANARERASSADVKEWAANTTSLIDTARPFFLAAFAVVFTTLGFVEGDSGTSEWFVAGAIIFVLAAGFSDELGHILPRRRREGDE